MDKTEVNRRIEIMRSLNGIQPMYMPFYALTLRSKIESASLSLQRFYDLLAEDKPTHAVGALDEFLMHAAGVSRYFFPSAPKTKKPLTGYKCLHVLRGANLRERFSVDDHSPIADRELRNALEHFDERLDKYLLGDLAGNFFPEPIFGSITELDDPVTKYFKFIDPVEHKYVLFGVMHDYEQIALELNRIYEFFRA